MVRDTDVKGVALYVNVENAQLVGELTIFGCGICGAPKYSKHTYKLNQNLKELPWNEMGLSNVNLNGEETSIFFMFEPNKNWSVHPIYHDLKVNNYGKVTYIHGNVEFTISVEELFGEVPQHLHNQKGFVCEWQLRINSIRTATTTCMYGEQHGHPEGWGDKLIAVKILAKVI